MTNDLSQSLYSISFLNLTFLVFVVKQVSLFFFPLPKKEPKKATAKEHLTGVRSVPAGDVLKAVMIFRTNNSNCPGCLLSPISFSPFLLFSLS